LIRLNRRCGAGIINSGKGASEALLLTGDVGQSSVDQADIVFARILGSLSCHLRSG
jgi:hypothetical protein